MILGKLCDDGNDDNEQKNDNNRNDDRSELPVLAPQLLFERRGLLLECRRLLVKLDGFRFDVLRLCLIFQHFVDVIRHDFCYLNEPEQVDDNKC